MSLFKKNKPKSHAEVMKNFITAKMDLEHLLTETKDRLATLDNKYEADLAEVKARMQEIDMAYINTKDALEIERDRLEKSLKFFDEVEM